MKKLIGLEPVQVFSYFEELSAIPRGSYNIDRISDYLVDFAKSNNLRYIQDEFKNVIIYKGATKGYEQAEPLIIQGHMDMVAVKDDDCDLELSVDAIRLMHDEQYIFADKTSLGGDDGIAIAYALAILASDSIKHPALECVFTTNEETGMDGAINLDTSVLSGNVLLNIDSEDEGILTIGCAGGARLEIEIEGNRCAYKGKQYSIEVSGITGGHSGVMIHKGGANANVVLARILRELRKDYDFRLCEFVGGDKTNAITVSSCCTIILENDCDLVEHFTELIDRIKHEYNITDSKMIGRLNCSEKKLEGLSKEATDKIIDLINLAPYGVVHYSNRIEGLPETSLNLGVVSMHADSDKFVAKYEIRSNVGSRLDDLIDRVSLLANCLGAKVRNSSRYPEWESKDDSKLQRVMIEVFERKYGYKPKIDIIHAGLECGVFASKIMNLDAVSFGPDMLDIHTTKERLSIESTKRVWEYLLAILEAWK